VNPIPPEPRGAAQPFSAEYTAASLITQVNLVFFTAVEVLPNCRKARVSGRLFGCWHQYHHRAGPMREVDIMEFVGKEPDKVHGTMHFLRTIAMLPRRRALHYCTLQEFHIYAVEWFPERWTFT